MFLSPEEKAVGKENFCAAVGSPHVRREFLMKGIAAGVASGSGLGPMYYGYGAKVSEPLRVGVIGTGDEGSVLLGAINPNYIEVKAIADIRPYSVYRAFHGEADVEARRGLMAVYDWKTEDEAREHVKVYGAYQELLENAEKDGLEGVIIALPLHLHAPVAIAAMKAGKKGLHVLTEKLMAKTVYECKEMARFAKQTGLHLATGHQRHYNILYDNAFELIQRGLLGDLHYIRAQWHRSNLPGADSWQQPMPRKAKPKDKQADKLDRQLESFQKALERAKKEKKAAEIETWERKIKEKTAQISDEIIADKAEQYGYVSTQLKDGKEVYDRPAIEELLRWRLFDRTGAGLMAELGSHQLDASSIFISAMHGGVKQHPLSVAAASNRPLFPPDRDVEDHVFCVFEFPAPGYRDPEDPERVLDPNKKIAVQYASINGNGFGGYGETVFGTEGTLVLETETDVLLFQGADTASKTRVVLGKRTGGKGPAPMLTTEHGVDKEKERNLKELAEATAVGQLGTLPAKRGYTEELEHWAWCVRNPSPENQPRCHPKVAMGDAVIALSTNMAARKGARMEFKEAWFDIDSDETPEGVAPDLSRYK